MFWFKNPAIWLAESICAYISGTRYRTCTATQQNNIKFHYRTNSVIIIDQIFVWIQKPCFWLILQFWDKISFFQKNPDLPHTTWWGSLAPWQNSEKTMIRFLKNNRESGRAKGWTNPISLNPSGYCPGYSKYNCSRTAFECQRCRVWCWSNQKQLHHSQLAKNQLNS